jgi:hypothetical protein
VRGGGRNGNSDNEFEREETKVQLIVGDEIDAAVESESIAGEGERVEATILVLEILWWFGVSW